MKKYSITTIKLFLSVFIVLVGVFFINTIQAHAANVPSSYRNEDGSQISNLYCDWQNTATIRCGKSNDPRGANYSLDLNASLDAGHLVFATDYGKGADGTREEATNRHGFLHFGKNNTFNDATITDSPTDPSGGATIINVNRQEIAINGEPVRTEPANVCSLTNFKAGCTNGYVQNSVSKNSLSQADVDKVKAIYTEMLEKAELLNACDNSNAPLPFIFCPIVNGVQDAIGGLIGGSGQVTAAGGRQGLLISFLSLPPIDTRDPNAVLNIVMGTVVNIANSLYIIIFILLIFSGSIPFLNLDSYTIKKTLPKFIGAIILTQFALPICSVIVDFFNLIALAIPNVLFALVQGLGSATSETASTASKVVGGIGGTLLAGGAVGGGLVAAATIGWPLILILGIFALIAAIVAIAYLLIRYFILYVLIILSPLAFACWVLPGTEKFFKMWWKNFIKLNAMFVTIMALLSGSLVISLIISRLPGTANGALIAAVIPIIALLLVPKTLKWTTQGMNAIATGALGAVTGAGSKAAKANLGNAKKAQEEGKNKYADVDNVFGRTASAGVGGFFNTKASQRQRASRAGKYANERNSEVQFAYNKSNGELSGEIARIKADPTIVDKDKAEKEATILSATKMVKNTSSDATSRQALMVAAAQSGDTTTLRALQSVMTGQEWDAGVANNYSAFDGVAQYRAYDPSYKTSIDIDDTSIGTGTKLAAEGLKGGDLTKLSSGAQKDIVTQKAAVPLQSFIDAHADTTGRAKVSQKLRLEAYQRALSNPTDPASAGVQRVIDASGNWTT